MYKCQYIGKLAYDIWLTMSQALNTCEHIDYAEGIVSNKSFSGGLHACKRGYDGYSIDYDMNSMYGYVLAHTNFEFPTRKGTFGHLTNDEFHKLPYLKYGLYHCELSYNGNDETKRNIIESIISSNDWYGHFDLKAIQSLGGSVHMIQNGSANVLYYENACVKGSKVFSSYMDYMYDLRIKNPDCDKMITPFISSLWGSICEHNYKTKHVKKDDVYNVNGLIEGIEPLDNGTHVMTEIGHNQTSLFKHNEARLGTFFYILCTVFNYKTTRR